MIEALRTVLAAVVILSLLIIWLGFPPRRSR